MSELSERARDLAEKMSHSLCADREERQQANANLIEQALLAERRLAMEACAGLAKKFGQDSQGSYSPDESIRETFNAGLVYGSLKIHEVLRAAAEKESVPRGEGIDDH